MKIAIINMVDKGSTGKIMLQIADVARSIGNDVRTYSKKWKKQIAPNKFHSYFGSTFDHGLHKLLAEIDGKHGSYSFISTLSLVKEIKAFDPDIIHLHNIHDDCINLKVLFDYLATSKKRVVWTLHDCWPFTGRCPHFLVTGCKKWMSHCAACPYENTEYPKAKLDNTSMMFDLKKSLFTKMDNMILVTPSVWLSKLVKQSFLQKYQVKVINNGINLEVFKPTKSDFRERIDADRKFIILGVSFGWGWRKGLDVFVELSKRLDSKLFQIVLVGTNDSIDKILPSNIISIHRTHNQQELAEIYTAADVFFNPTREDNFPTVNLEALACGCPVVTFNTGGAPEMVNHYTGSVLSSNTVEEALKILCNLQQNSFLNRDTAVQYAKNYNMNDKYQEYIKLYERIMKEKIH